MDVSHTRVQHPVGQGFFHSGHLKDRIGTCRLRYVIDCGSKAKYKAAREKQIDDFVKLPGSNRLLNLLMVSHIHEDHVNGIERLLDKKSGLKVDTIMMPLTTVQERLIAFARSIAEDASAAGSEFFRRFVISPEEALSEFGPRQIVLVRPGAPDDGAPGGTSEPDAPLPESEGQFDSDDGKPLPEWRFVGKGRIVHRTHSSRNGSANSVRISTLPDSVGIELPVGHGDWKWLILPYVDPKVEAGIAKFERMLARRLGFKVADVRKQMGNADYVKDLIVKHVEELKAAYLKVASDLNVTSLCLYSGPAAPADKSEGRWFAGDCEVPWLGCFRLSEGGGWLGTGDAALKEKKRLDLFLEHYQHLLDQVSTLTMPHHGSERNFHPDLLDSIRPSRCVAAADDFSNWRHPGTSVVQSVASRGMPLFVATADERSEFSERLDIYFS
ncbi:hypothetical protein [Phaeobacter sp. B1627]|uniref:hypothetical protein n=1 Tax=Phaeobacter sp. B1627 TaxID=2583809 RepID=UPI0011191472|nr:hypothetical protein [Phaeobacter sp. B1627]TNJ43381.1 hypothetical protein FGE21_09900 [Phaeobacter sp. B1627]